MPKPLYRPLMPSFLNTFLRQSASPRNSLSDPDLPRSTAIRVLAKSRGWTKQVVVLPARPPQRIL